MNDLWIIDGFFDLVQKLPREFSFQLREAMTTERTEFEQKTRGARAVGGGQIAMANEARADKGGNSASES